MITITPSRPLITEAKTLGKIIERYGITHATPDNDFSDHLGEMLFAATMDQVNATAENTGFMDAGAGSAMPQGAMRALMTNASMNLRNLPQELKEEEMAGKQEVLDAAAKSADNLAKLLDQLAKARYELLTQESLNVRLNTLRVIEQYKDRIEVALGVGTSNTIFTGLQGVAKAALEFNPPNDTPGMTKGFAQRIRQT